MARNVPNSASNQPISHEIVHIVDSQRRNRTLCGTKLENKVSAEPDCIVCLDILEYRLGREPEED